MQTDEQGIIRGLSHPRKSDLHTRKVGKNFHGVLSEPLCNQPSDAEEHRVACSEQRYLPVLIIVPDIVQGLIHTRVDDDPLFYVIIFLIASKDL